MPSSIERSAPAENASLPEVTTTPLMAGSAEVCFTIASSSVMVVSSSTFIERPGMSQVTSAMPSASVSSLKFLKAICCSRFDIPSPLVGEGSERSEGGEGSASTEADPSPGSNSLHVFSPPSPTRGEGEKSNPLDDGRGAHAAADAQRDQRGLLVGALELVEHGAEDHRTRRPQRMAERDCSAIDVDLGAVDVEGLHVAQHHGGERLVQLEQIDVGFLHARTFEQLLGGIDRPGQHHRGLRADIGKGADLCPRLQAVFAARLLAAEQHRAGAVDDAGRIAGVMHVVDALDLG